MRDKSVEKWTPGIFRLLTQKAVRSYHNPHDASSERKYSFILIIYLRNSFLCRMLKQWVKRKKRGTKKEENKPRWEADYELVENEGLFQEYLEMSEYKNTPHY